MTVSVKKIARVLGMCVGGRFFDVTMGKFVVGIVDGWYVTIFVDTVSKSCHRIVRGGVIV